MRLQKHTLFLAPATIAVAVFTGIGPASADPPADPPQGPGIDLPAPASCAAEVATRPKGGGDRVSHEARDGGAADLGQCKEG